MSLPVVYDEGYVSPLPDGHRFPMQKFERVHRILQNQFNSSNLEFHDPLEDPYSWILQAHSESYVENFQRGTLPQSHIREIGLPWSKKLVERTVTAVGGTLRTVDLALKNDRACNTAGGTHHAFPDRGSGFCILNDLAVGAHRALNYHNLSRVMILDLDVHQGNGTAAFFREEPRVETISIHCEANYPFERTDGDRDLEILPGTTNKEYFEILRIKLPKWITELQPELLIYDAGVDVHRDDRLGKLQLTNEGICQRDHLVFEIAHDCGIPTAAVIGGGYDENLERLAERHTILHQTAQKL